MNHRQIVRRTLELLQQGDPRDHDPTDLMPMIGLAGPDTEWDLSDAICDGKVYRGRQGLIDFFRSYLGTWETWAWQVESVVAFGPLVVARVREVGVSRASGVEVEQRHWQVWSFDGLGLARWRVFMSEGEALEALHEVEAA